MLASLLDCLSHVTNHSGLVWCSMKSIGRVSLCNKIARRMAISLRVIVSHVSHGAYQTALQAALDFIVVKLKNGSCVPFPYQTTQGRNIPQKRSHIEIWPNQSQRLKRILSKLIPQVLTSITYFSQTHKRFLHACTPERRTPALVCLFTQREHGHRPDTIKHILQKDLQNAETLGNDSSGAASEPHRFKYILVGRSVGLEMTLLR